MALTAAGIQKWAFETRGVVRSSPAVSADGTIYFGSEDKSLYAVAAHGTKRWEFATAGAIRSPPAIGADGTVYIVSADGNLYAIKGTAGLANSPWPKYRGNLRNTGNVLDSPIVSGDGSVSNVRATQRPGTTLVDLFYDLSGAGSGYSVSVAVSSDGGASFAMPATHFTGDGVTSPAAPGAARHIVWDAGADLGAGYFPNVVVQLSAGGSWTRSGVFLLNLNRPWITSQPQSQNAPAGANVTLGVSATGTGQLSYQWRKNGADLPGQTAATLTLNSVSPSDSDGYSVLVWNAYGSAGSATAYLAVLADGANGVPPQQITSHPIPARQPSQDSLVIVTHGWEVVGQSAAWIDQMASAISSRLASQGKANWQVVPVHWEEAAWGLPVMALSGARIEGALYGAEFAQVHWQHVHLLKLAY